MLAKPSPMRVACDAACLSGGAAVEVLREAQSEKRSTTAMVRALGIAFFKTHGSRSGRRLRFRFAYQLTRCDVGEMPVGCMQFTRDEGAYAARMNARWRQMANRSCSVDVALAAAFAVERSDPELSVDICRRLIARRRADQAARAAAAEQLVTSIRRLARMRAPRKRLRLLLEATSVAPLLSGRVLGNVALDLGEAFEELGSNENARRWFQHCLDAEPQESPYRKRAGQGLERLKGRSSGGPSGRWPG